MVVDVRTVPRSRRNPQYNEDVLGAELAPYQIGYRRIADLGGLREDDRPKFQPGVNGFWENQSFHNYADYALSERFAAAIDELWNAERDRGDARSCARKPCGGAAIGRIIADYLLARGQTGAPLTWELIRI